MTSCPQNSRILQRRKLQALLKPNFLSRDYLALTTQKTP